MGLCTDLSDSIYVLIVNILTINIESFVLLDISIRQVCFVPYPCTPLHSCLIGCQTMEKLEHVFVLPRIIHCLPLRYSVVVV